jgi:DNA invertase Pin-like site-specific DNA recombinase
VTVPSNGGTSQIRTSPPVGRLGFTASRSAASTLTSSTAGKMTMGVLGAVAEFERDLMIERTQAGLARARAEGKALSDVRRH